jgi:UDP-glucose 4-epimerase
MKFKRPLSTHENVTTLRTFTLKYFNRVSACHTARVGEKITNILLWWRNLKEDHFEGIDGDGRIILKLI